MSTAILMSAEVGRDHPLVPPAARALAERIEGSRLLLSVATCVGKRGCSTWLSVQWRVDGRPPTIMALWRDGKRDHAMYGLTRTTHTAVGALR